ncbi:hypothetical protein AB4141_40540, partial [Cupriavidus sp. 2KB_15]|uniref:hypothetical protein n=1 Tax=Cupriavidus sp. 2KB_15 TaxID=3232976 RepID=UPI003F8DCDBB
EPPKPDGVRRVNDQCVELETYANFTRTSTAGFIGMSVLVTIAAMLFMLAIVDKEKITFQMVGTLVISAPSLPAMAFLFYFASGAHRSRGAFIRIHRGTRKLYFIFPGTERLHVLDWNQLEALAGYIPIVSASGYASRHPLYLIGVDYTMDPSTEICAACGNLGLFDGDRSA